MTGKTSSLPHWAVNAEIRAAWGMAEVTLATSRAGLL